VGRRSQQRGAAQRSGLRDVLVVAGVVVAVVIVGAVTDAFDALQPLLTGTSTGHDILGGALVLAIGVAVVAILQARDARRQATLRRTADEQLRALISESPVVSFTWLPQEHRYRYVSPQVEQLLGVPLEEHLTDWSAQIHPDDRDRALEASTISDRDATTYLSEYRIIKPDGTVRWIHDEAHYYGFDANGRPQLAQGVMFDITERKEAEARAAEAEGQLRTLIERVPAIAYSWDVAFASGTAPADYISPQIEHMLGVTAQSWIDDPTAWSRHAHPDDRDRVSATWEAACAASEPFSAEYRLRTASGAWLWVRDEANPVGVGSHGAPIYQGVIVDITDRHAAEEEVRDAERRWRLLLDELPIVAYEITMDANGTTLDRWVAAGIDQLIGVPAAAWVDDDQGWERRVHADDRGGVLAAWRLLETGGAPFDVQYRMYHADGHLIWVHDRAALTEREGRRIIEGAYVDITPWRRAETALGEAEERFRTLVEQLPAITFIEDHATNDILYISPQIQEIYGYTAEEWIADPSLWEQRLHPDDHDWVVASDTADGGDAWSVDYRTLTRDGRMLWIHNESRLIRDADGAPRYWQGVVYDITERKTAEERLRNAEERYRTLVEQLPVAIYTDAVDDIATALYISPQYEQLTGYTPEQRLLDPELWVRMLHPDDRERVLELSDATNRTGEPFDVEYRIIAADGRTVWLHDHAMQVTDPDGNQRWHGVLQDITESRLAAEGLARRDAILEATSLAAERFLRSPAWREQLTEVLEQLGRAGQATRCAVFRNHELDGGALAVSIVDAWAVPGTTAENDESRHDFAWVGGGFERWVTELGAGRIIHGRVEDFPAGEQALLADGPFAIRSLLAIPIFAEGQWWGYISFDHVDEDRLWAEADIEALTLTASTIGAAIERELAVDRLDEATTLYRSLIEQLPAVTYIEDNETGDQLYVSPQVHSLLGYTPEEFGPYEGWNNKIHPDDRERVEAIDDEATERGEPYRSEYRLITADGAVVWVRDEASLVRDPDGAPRYWQGVLFDITPAKEAEEQLRQAEERYRLLVEEMPVISYLDELDAATGDWETRYVSPQIERILGFPPEEWLGDAWRWRAQIHPDDRERAAAADAEHYETGEPLDIELRYYDQQGRERWVRDQAVIIRNERGEPAFSQGIIQDVTERKLAEERLQDAEQRYRAIVEHVPAAIYLDRPDGETTYMSPQIADIAGVTPDEWMSDADFWNTLVVPEDRDRIQRSSARAAEAGEPWRAEYRIRTPDGRTVWIHDETTVLRDENGAPSFVQGVLFDITERKLAEQALRESEQREREAAERLRGLDEMKNTFLAAVSHELRSPLTSILGLALTLERAPDIEGRDRDDLLTRLAANAKKLDRLLKDLLDIDRLNRGIVAPQYRVTDVAALSRRTVEHLDALVGREVIVETDPVVIPVDPPKIERIVENLLMNAVRHTEEDRRIWLIVLPHEGGVRITVEDDGPGVPPELRAAIFEPFRQGPTQSPHAPGTGIGLSLVARFAELHGGRAWTDEREGGGASFHVVIPGRVPDHETDEATAASDAQADAG
jgi:PAS domain S-box-containing protein